MASEPFVQPHHLQMRFWDSGWKSDRGKVTQVGGRAGVSSFPGPYRSRRMLVKHLLVLTWRSSPFCCRNDHTPFQSGYQMSLFIKCVQCARHIVSYIYITYDLWFLRQPFKTGHIKPIFQMGKRAQRGWLACSGFPVSLGSGRAGCELCLCLLGGWRSELLFIRPWLLRHQKNASSPSGPGVPLKNRDSQLSMRQKAGNSTRQALNIPAGFSVRTDLESGLTATALIAVSILKPMEIVNTCPQKLSQKPLGQWGCVQKLIAPISEELPHELHYSQNLYRELPYLPVPVPYPWWELKKKLRKR